ncbi:hypothetical protein [Planctomicrobium sp. SH527]|uniref:hypothetical protein n=1 Tax=Planctomicrobium sp. SH527 TaxID=3448123 RepID=UPI003F5BC551
METGSRDSRQNVIVAAGVLILCVIGWFAFQWWTRPIAVEFDNLKYIQLLTTAVSNRSPEMIEKVNLAIDERSKEGKMSQPERQHFQNIIQQARNDEWEAAHRASFAFAEAQLNRRRSQAPTDNHEHSHDHSHDHDHKKHSDKK